jgi:hypothetical protein
MSSSNELGPRGRGRLAAPSGRRCSRKPNKVSRISPSTLNHSRLITRSHQPWTHVAFGTQGSPSQSDRDPVAFRTAGSTGAALHTAGYI